ncbi:hypothetical protein ACN2C7_11060 [Caulobacter sp. ErkDOM-E]|uniref:hypothetical protein n=1 Tax=Caulobacter sp. ErkDOM-E TaxID=3402778 RepID=UPI003AF4BB83
MSRPSPGELKTWREFAAAANAAARKPTARARELAKLAAVASKTVVPSRDANDFALCELLVRTARIFIEAAASRRLVMAPGLAALAGEVAGLAGEPQMAAVPAEGDPGFRRDLFG